MKRVFVTYHHMADDKAALAVSFNNPVLRDEEIGRTVKSFGFADWQSLCRMASKELEIAKTALVNAETAEVEANQKVSTLGDIETEIQNKSFDGEDVAEELAVASANFQQAESERLAACENTNQAEKKLATALNAFRNLGANLNESWK
jgi:hypothetical protein